MDNSEKLATFCTQHTERGQTDQKTKTKKTTQTQKTKTMSNMDPHQKSRMNPGSRERQ